MSEASLEGPADAPVLVLANPLGTTSAIWDGVVPALRERFRLLRFDLPGHGGRAARRGSYTPAQLGTEVLGLLNEAGVGQAGFAGVSIGGMTGLWLAAHAPDRINSLAVVCTAIEPVPSAQAWRDRSALVRASGMAAIAEMVVPRWFTPGFVARSPDRVAAVLDMLKSCDPEGYAGCGDAIAAMDLLPVLGSVRAPTLVVSGAEDPAAPPSHGARTARAIPGAKFTVIRGTSHLAVYETPGPVTAALLSHFLSN
jgi:3-oxoadipate enol-lactonase